MKQDFDSDMLYDHTKSETQITTPEQFQKAEINEEEIENEDALIEIEATRTQLMKIEDFMHMFENKVKSIENMENQIQGIKDGIEEYENTYEEEMEYMKRLDKEKKSDTTREPVPANSLTYNHMEAYKKLWNERKQIEKLKENKKNVMQQIEDLWPTAQDLFDEGQPVPKAVQEADFLDTDNEDWEVEETGYEEIDTESEE